MPLIAHLLELRRRLMVAALAIVAASIGGWFIAPIVIAALQAPIAAGGKTGDRFATLNFDTITGAFDAQLEIAIVLGIVLASPVWLYQVFAFLTPAFTRTEKRYVFGFFFSAIPLFLAGCAAGWLLVPHMVVLMTGFAGAGTSTIITAKTYLDFVLQLVLILGVAFTLPVFLVLLDFVGVLTARSILKGWRIAVLAILVFTALATPSADVLSMLLLAAPMLVLYFGAAGVAFLHDRRAAARAAATLDAPAGVL